jgi:hypothetical protein
VNLGHGDSLESAALSWRRHRVGSKPVNGAR